MAVVKGHFLVNLQSGEDSVFQENEVYTQKEATEVEKRKAADHTHTHTECVYERKREEREEERALENEFLIPFIHETLLHLPVLWIFNSSLIYTKYSSTHQTNHTLLQASLG